MKKYTYSIQEEDGIFYIVLPLPGEKKLYFARKKNEIT